jgi:hypothetical protein
MRMHAKARSVMPRALLEPLWLHQAATPLLAPEETNVPTCGPGDEISASLVPRLIDGDILPLDEFPCNPYHGRHPTTSR